MKVFVLGHQETALIASELPDQRVSRAAGSEEANVERIGKDVGQQGHQLFRQLFVEEQAHGSSRTAERPTLPFGSVGQARPDVVARQLREVPTISSSDIPPAR